MIQNGVYLCKNIPKMYKYLRNSVSKMWFRWRCLDAVVWLILPTKRKKMYYMVAAFGVLGVSPRRGGSGKT